MNQDKEVMTMTYSSVLKKDGKSCVCVRFDRNQDFAEYLIPGGSMLKAKGFTEEEKAGLIGYIKMNQNEIIQMSKKISGIKNWF